MRFEPPLPKGRGYSTVDKVTKETVITFGRHKGRILGEVLKADFSYIVWLYKNIDESSKGLYRWLHRKPLKAKILDYKPPYLRDKQSYL